MQTDTIRHQELGSTGLKVSALGLGTAALGRPGYINMGHAADLSGKYQRPVLEQHLHSLLETAWQAGICYFDTARSYGEAERFVSNWLNQRQINQHDVHVGSKWGYTYTAGWQIKAKKHEQKDHSRKTLDQQWEESQQALGKYLKLYQIHSATPESKVLDDQQVLARLGALKDQGVRIGLTVSGPQQNALIERATQISHGDGLLFDCVQATWNLLEPSATVPLMKARAAGLGVIVKEALANGRLTPRNREPEYQDALKQLQGIAAELDTTVQSLSLAAALSRPFADVVLSGAATEEHLTENVQAATMPWDRALDEQLAAVAEPAEQYWKYRAKMPWN